MATSLAVTVQAKYTISSTLPVPTIPTNAISLSQEEPTLAASTREAATSAYRPALEVVSTVTEQHRYIYAGGRLLQETITTTAADGAVTKEVLDFAYDAQGTPYSLTDTDGTGRPVTFYYITNLQGDVTYLINSSGTKVAAYEYDPYGKITYSTGTMAETNPLRYRGYCYDADTQFYYLQSRYYDAAICRFINADSYIASSQEITGYNMFAYCNNSPITYLDEHGTFLGTLIGAVVGAAIGALDAAINGEDVLAGAASGAVSGAITGFAADVIAVTGGTAAVVIGVSAGASALGSVAGNVVENVVSGEEFDKEWCVETATEAIWSGAFGALFGYMSGPVASQLDKVAKKGIGKVISDTFCRNFGKKAAETAAEEVLSSSITGVAGLFVRGCVRMVQELM